MAIKNGNFTTRNTALAAYLRITGFTLLDVEPTMFDAPASFYFESNPRIEEYAHLWQMRKAIGNLNDYWESYRLCLRMVKVGKL
jgi:hypothetical protein